MRASAKGTAGRARSASAEHDEAVSSEPAFPWRSWPRMIGQTLVLLGTCASCVVAPWLAPILAGMLHVLALRAVGRNAPGSSGLLWLPGVLALLHAGALLGGIVIAIGAAESTELA